MAAAPTLFLKKHSDYQRAYAASVRGRTQLMTWFAARPEEEGAANDVAAGSAHRPASHATNSQAKGSGLRVGLTVPKALGIAVVRNRIKRRMREAVRQSAGEALAAQPLDLILHPRRAVESCPWPELLADVGRVLCEAPRALVKRGAANAKSSGATGRKSAGENRKPRAKVRQ